MTATTADEPAAYSLPFDDQLRLFLDDHRAALATCLDGMSEAQARRRVVGSNTTLLGLVKHVTFVERVWFEEAITGRSRAELGIVAGPHESFVLDDHDTIETIVAGYRTACERSRAAIAGRDLDATVSGNRRGELPLRWIMLHMLRELAQHCGHADIVREQLLDAVD